MKKLLRYGVSRIIVSVGLVLLSMMFAKQALFELTPPLFEQTNTESSIVTGPLVWEEDENGDLRPRNLRLAFIGDSLTRFHYISLVHFLKTGNWTDDRRTPMLMDSHKAATWSEWIDYSSSLLQPEERCDCYRGGGYDKTLGNWGEAVNENRYYRDKRGNCITLLVKFGKAPVNGHWAPDEIYKDGGPHLIDNDHFIPYSYRYNWSGAIRHLGSMTVKPEFLILNAGLHPHDLEDEAVQQDIMRAVNETGIIVIYKTTTFKNWETHSRRKYGRHDGTLCKLAGHCLNMSWTAELPMKYYNNEDKLHFNSDINTLMSRQLLRYLKFEFHPDVARFPYNKQTGINLSLPFRWRK